MPSITICIYSKPLLAGCCSSMYQTDYGINCYFSDNNGISWVEATQITGFSFIDLSVIEIEPDKIILSFSSRIRWRYSSQL